MGATATCMGLTAIGAGAMFETAGAIATGGGSGFEADAADDRLSDAQLVSTKVLTAIKTLTNLTFFMGKDSWN
ncbi:MAG: hypothetical protein NT077_00915, partial [Candidatus Taylorbacteria bacterium]|nr:hypothetical protein [Candidatus Taylorbacteria bacterium]